MARQLSDNNTRVSVTGDDTAPSTCAVETRVTDGDLAEAPSNTPVAGPDFNQTVNALCAAEIAVVKTNESI